MAFSCCLYDGGEAEKIEMDFIREKGWRLKFKQKSRVILPGLNRIQGKCPLTPLEVLEIQNVYSFWYLQNFKIELSNHLLY